MLSLQNLFETLQDEQVAPSLRARAMSFKALAEDRFKVKFDVGYVEEDEYAPTIVEGV